VFGSEPEEPILDWGCGSGRTLRWLWGFPGWRQAYHGCDVDAEAIDWLRQAGVRNVLVNRDDPPLPYEDSVFGGLFAFSVLTHIHPDRHRPWYAELARVLRPGGKALLTTQGSAIVADSQYRLPAGVREDYAKNGFVYFEHEGHYKSAALVSEEFTRTASDGILQIEDYRVRGYANMDAFVTVKPGA
jgi:SAM-dependent methyltransferase